MNLKRLEKARKGVTALVVVALAAAVAYTVSSVVVAHRPAFSLTANKAFTITSAMYAAYPTCSGTATAKLYPSTTRCIVVTVHNPLSVPIRVNSLSMTVTSFTPTPSNHATTPACKPTMVHPPTLFSTAFSVTPHTTHTIDKAIKLSTTGTQDACQNGTFNFTFQGTATYTDTTTTTLTSTKNPSVAETPVTLTAVVTPSNPKTDTFGPQGAPDHTVSFYACTTATCTHKSLLGTKSLAVKTATNKTASATYTTGNLHYGTHYFEAIYTGTTTATPDFSGSHAILTQHVTLSCQSHVTIHGDTTVVTGETLCLVTSTVDGDVKVQKGGSIYFTNVTDNGNISATGAITLRICGSTLHGGITSNKASGFVYVGDGKGDDSPPCAGNTIKGGVTIGNGTGGFELGGNTIAGTVTLNGNSGTGGSSEGANEVEGNSVKGSLNCATSNSPALSDGTKSNSVIGKRTGQCSGSTF